MSNPDPQNGDKCIFLEDGSICTVVDAYVTVEVEFNRSGMYAERIINDWDQFERDFKLIKNMTPVEQALYGVSNNAG